MHLTYLTNISNLDLVKVLFINQHQVLDGDHHDICKSTGVVSEENIEVFGRFSQFAYDHGRIPFIFVLSCIGSSRRYQACKDVWSRSTGIDEFLSGIICIFEPGGETRSLSNSWAITCFFF